MQTNCNFIASNFVIFWCLYSKFFPVLIANNFLCHCVLLLVYFAISLWLWKVVTADVTAVFVNKQHGIQLRGPDFD